MGIRKEVPAQHADREDTLRVSLMTATKPKESGVYLLAVVSAKML